MYAGVWLLEETLSTMTVHLVTFSDESMIQSALLCELSGKVSGADTSAIWNPHMLTEAGFYQNANEAMLESARRGCNYWQWKPFIIQQEINRLHDGDICLYSDAGIEFIAPVSHIIERMDQDVFLFGNNWEHAHWCKADVVHEIWQSGLRDRNNPGWSCFGKQVQASVIFFRVSDYSRAFVTEWLQWCLFEGGRLIDDSPSRAPNHPEFREHRHDQAILTTMAYRDGLRLHYWPASYNDGAFIYEKLPEYAGDDYPVLFSHHRKRNWEWQV